MADPIFGRLLTAMVTPFDAAGKVDHEAAGRVARWLIDEQSNDALVINGTTGESPTTSGQEKVELIRTVREAVGPDIPLVAGVGTFDTPHTIELARQAEEAGADGLLVVTPYYSKPPQDGIAAHFRAVADATQLPILLYDIPHRSGVPIAEATLLELAEHPRIVGVKDAKGDLASSGRVMARTDLAYYSGEDNLTLALLALGAVGLIGTSTHFTGAGAARMINAQVEGRHGEALTLHRALEPLFTGVFATQGCLLVKAGLERKGLIGPGVRLPLVPATPAQVDAFHALLDDAGM
ncbi:4-hydroxy-tetrahydrodipicolinate synthase [Naumannella cuiyingiana]|uniref:4-hydroxy-tetrahydrodipicolinate synthase n=1 Tax=Naumannella cuiyingiana TaxID=1347891 RepID=A0A7Z0DAW4_9ACTN|nr:4-hydroxy-tetrahydrodipicolinate synthase [Naumannella cuiyingiana]NYI71955.1 4-hydroxy-tetrahydrodipicolinate synthase [Naumannella cuiyingiana]